MHNEIGPWRGFAGTAWRDTIDVAAFTVTTSPRTTATTGS
jgi:hypothetical protein